MEDHNHYGGPTPYDASPLETGEFRLLTMSFMEDAPENLRMYYLE